MLKRTTLASADSAWAADGEQLDITNIVVTFALVPTQWCESANERPMRLLRQILGERGPKYEYLFRVHIL